MSTALGRCLPCLVATALAVAATTGCKPRKSSGYVETSAEAGIDFLHTDGSSGKYYIVETLASGVALFDFDEDGDLDIYFPNGRPLPPSSEGDRSASNALYRNDGGGRFTDVTAEKGVGGVGFSVGCCVGDYDGDGDLDLYVTGFGRNILYRNEGAAKAHAFTDVTAEAGCEDTRFSCGAAFVDYDRDGDLDLYVSNYCDPTLETSTPCTTRGVPSYCAPGIYEPVVDTLFRNEGDGRFTDVSDQAGIRVAKKWGMGVLTLDYDEDGWTDIYVANDVSNNFLWRNRGDGTFEDIAGDLGAALSSHGDEQGSMGVDGGDYDLDGREDIIVTNYHKQLNALYRNSDHLFVDRAMSQGLGETCLPMVSWGTKFFDFDNDGLPDLFIANGHLEDRIDEFDHSSTYLQQNQLFRNLGGGRFDEISDSAGPGFAELKSSRGAAFGDIDDDGDIDIVVCNSRDRPSLLINRFENENHWIQIRLRGKRNHWGIGARVRVTAGERSWLGTVRSGASYASQNDLRLHFGLGDATRVDKVVVRWPEGSTTEHTDLAVDRLHVIEE